jgi:uncharacterized protein YdhG (YjbR/CyaY superfamily)
MVSSSAHPDVDSYVAAAPARARAVLRKIRSIVRKVAPEADEIISYRIPAARRHGILIYYAAFKNHIGLFPPIKGDAPLDKLLAPYKGPKGNLRFPLDEPIPYDLIARIVKLRRKQDASKAADAKRKR